MKIATWNVERLKNKKYLHEILSEIEKIDADILILTETDSQILPENYPYKIETKPLILVNPLAKIQKIEFLFFLNFLLWTFLKRMTNSPFVPQKLKHLSENLLFMDPL